MKYIETGPKGGKARSRLYSIWLHMRGRCYRQTDDHYKHYGARGISIDHEWDSFENFMKWSLSHGYRPDLTIDRIDVNGNYSPDNCRWVDIKTQCNNRTSNVCVVIGGVSHNIKEWSEITGIKYATIYYRWKRGKRGDALLYGSRKEF